METSTEDVVAVSRVPVGDVDEYDHLLHDLDDLRRQESPYLQQVCL